MSEYVRYEIEIAKEAIIPTWTFIKKYILVGMLIAVLTGMIIGLYEWMNYEQLPTSIWVGLLAGIFAAFLISGFVLLWNTFTASYRLWNRQLKELENSKSKTENSGFDRIPLIALCKEAAQRGWNFLDPSLHILDLADGLRQAGIDGTIRFWGRKKQVTDNLTRRQPLVELQKQYWDKCGIYPMSCLAYKENSMESTGIAKDNFQTQSSKKNNGADYADIHVDMTQAISWLERDAKQFIGRNKR